MEPQCSGFYSPTSGAATAAIPRGLRPLGMAAHTAPSVLVVESLTFRWPSCIVPLRQRLTGEEVDLGGVIGVPDADDGVVAAGHDEAVVHVHRRRHVGPGRNL